MKHAHHDHHEVREASRRSLLAALVLTALLMVAERADPARASLDLLGFLRLGRFAGSRGM